METRGRLSRNGTAAPLFFSAIRTGERARFCGRLRSRASTAHFVNPVSVIHRPGGGAPPEFGHRGRRSGTVADAIGVSEQVFGADEQVLGQEQSDQEASGELAKKRFPMLSWANFYRGLANEATLRAAQMPNSSKRDKLEEVAKEWSALAEWVERRHRYS